jgi:hypothetical protein
MKSNMQLGSKVKVDCAAQIAMHKIRLSISTILPAKKATVYVTVSEYVSLGLHTLSLVFAYVRDT